MTALHDYNYRNAASALLLANTPLFLLRKLRSDPVVAAIVHDLTEDEIIRGLRTAAKEKPNDILEAVRPYVYLVALSLKGNAGSLKQAADIQAPHADWFSYIANSLLSG
jgi:hypothetical protein